jgi:hypothetical protein
MLIFTTALTLVPIGMVTVFIGIKVQSSDPEEGHRKEGDKNKVGNRRGTLEKNEVENDVAAQGRRRTEKCVVERESEDSGVAVEIPTLMLLIVNLSVVFLSTTAPVISRFGKSRRRLVVYSRREEGGGRRCDGVDME